MLLSLLLVTLLADGAQTAPAPTAQSFGEAAQLAMEGRNAEALTAFQKLAAANPNDHEARLWIARLHERMGKPAVAEAVYRSVLLEDPSNVNALIGVGTTLLARHATDEAIEVLGRAESVAPSSEVVLSALARAYREAGDNVRAIRYYERVVAASPNEQYRLRLEEVRMVHDHRIEAQGFSEEFNGASTTNSNGSALVNVRVGDTLRVVGRGDAQRKFGVSDQRGGGGVEWKFKPLTSFVGHFLIGPDNVVMPERDLLAEIDHTFGRTSWTGTYRYLDFNGASTAVFAPAVSFWPNDRLSIGVLYAHTVTQSDLFLTNQHGNNVQARLAYRFRPRIWLTGGFAEGIQNFETMSIDEIGDFRAHAFTGGFRFDLPSMTSVIGNADYQARPDDIRRVRFTFGLAQRF